ncbi:MAG: phosphotransferase [Tumebacillaceae bacterium]
MARILTDRLVSKLEQAYGLRFSHCVKLRTVIGVQTSGGAMIVKRYEGEGMKRRLEALCDALDTVLDAGVEIAPFLKTRTDLPYVIDQGALWTVQPWLPGRHVSLCSREERKLAAKSLAALHRVRTGKDLQKSLYLRVPPLWEKYQHRLERATDATIKDLSLRDSWRPYAERARQAIWEMQQDGACLIAMERDARYGSFCHRDPAPHNFMRQEDGAALIDFDLAGYDVRAHDLYQLMNHALYLNGWEAGLFEEMTEAYDRVFPLCRDNRRVLHALMRYPNLVVREWYDFGKAKNRHAFRTRLQWATEQEAKRAEERSLISY